MRERQAPSAETAADVLDLGVAPAVDRLLRVPDHRNIAEAVRGQQADEVELDAVGVLELVDEQIAESFAAAAAKLGHALQRVDDGQDQVVEVAQPGLRQRFLVRAVDEVEHVDGLALRASRKDRIASRLLAAALRSRGPVSQVQLVRPLVELVGPDAAALQLQDESKPKPQQLVQLLHAQRHKRVRIEGSRGAAAELRDERLLEKALAGLIEHAQLARGADEVRELLEQTRARAMERADPRAVHHLRAELRSPSRQLGCDALAKLVCRAVVEGDRQDPVGRHALLDQPAESLRRRVGLACAWAGRDEEGAVRTRVRRRRLLRAQRANAHAHSGGCPP